MYLYLINNLSRLRLAQPVSFSLKNHNAPVSQANRCNMTFTAGNLFTSHSCIGVTRVKPPLGFVPGFPACRVDDLPTELSLPPDKFLVALGY